ncbi:hypothetical protein IJE86_08110 [bacterium]|nr:hypothetical protein [bacterium]
MGDFNEEEEFERIKRKREEQKNEMVLSSKINDSIAEYYDNSLAERTGKIQGLTEKLVDAEIDVKEKQIEGRKAVLKAQTEKDVTRANTEVDEEKTERSRTILKAQGLTEKLPPAFRVTALIVGYPFFLVYLLTLGWMIEFVTFVIKGFITMVFDCADRYVELNKKFTENEKDFKLGKAIFNILKWALITTAIVVLLVLLTRQ